MGAGEPFDIVHFDGHGLVVDDHLPAAPTARKAYIVFEDPSTANGRLVSGDEFAALLAETGPAVVVLNACRSAYVGIPDRQVEAGLNTPAKSFSHDLVANGARIVVAMNYNAYVVSAVRFMAEFYRQLANGRSVIAAVSLARKDMATVTGWAEGISSFAVEDWIVPVIFQSGDDMAIAGTGSLSTQAPVSNFAFTSFSPLPPEPDLGFVGADGSLLAIDRAFDDHRVTLVHGLAGAGKTAISVEFARWYSITGGIDSTPLFTSFEGKKTLDAVLADIEPMLARRAGAEWVHMTTAQRAELAPKLLAGQSIFWIWDNIETWNGLQQHEQAALVAFLRSAAAGGVKFLLTARGSELAVLGHLPVRLEVTPLSISDSAEFARRLASRHGAQTIDRSALGPLLVYCEGNPLTLGVALANLLDKYQNPAPEQVEAFVRELQAGQSALDDLNIDDRSRSLTASLHVGFAALNHATLRRLALLYLFHRYANVNVLFGMFRGTQDGVLSDLAYDRNWTLREFAEDTPITLDRILHRAAEVGLLRRPKAQHYWLHPALHLHLGKYFRRFFPRDSGFQRAARAFAESLGALSILFTLAHSHGRQEQVLTALSDEEDNLRHAFALSRQFGWLQATTGLIHGLFTLYWNTGRRLEWAQLITEVLPDFVDDRGQARPGTERWWTFMMDQAVRVEMWRRDWQKAEQLARIVLAEEEKLAEPLAWIPPEALSLPQNKQLQSFAISLARLADILRERDDPECLGLDERALDVYTHIDDRLGMSIRLFNLGHVYKNVPALRDLDKSEESYRRALDLYPEYDRVSRRQCVAQLGSVRLQRVKDEIETLKRPDVITNYLNTAIEYYEWVLGDTPPDDILGLADVHNQLGIAYQYDADEQNTAFDHFRQATEYSDLAGESYQAASSRNNAVLSLERLDRIDEAIVFAREALATFEALDPDSPLATHLRRLVSKLERKRKSNS
jgi:tetratricopeptide (TPR) repeat protein